MNAETIIKRARADGVSIGMSHTGALKAKGDREAVARWLDTLRQHKDTLLRALQESSPAPTIRTCWWVVGYADRALEVCCWPPATEAEVLASRPTALAAHPLSKKPSPAPHPLTAGEKSALTAWLASIGEDDPEIIRAVIRQCSEDPAARLYFVRQAAGLSRHVRPLGEAWDITD